MIFNKMMMATIGLSILSASVSNATATYSVPQSTNGTFSDASGTSNHDSKPASHDATANPSVPHTTNSTSSHNSKPDGKNAYREYHESTTSKPAPTSAQLLAALDAYHFFGLSSNASFEEVKAKDATLAKEAHDRLKVSQDRLKEINHHYEILKDHYGQK